MSNAKSQKENVADIWLISDLLMHTLAIYSTEEVQHRRGAVHNMAQYSYLRELPLLTCLQTDLGMSISKLHRLGRGFSGVDVYTPWSDTVLHRQNTVHTLQALSCRAEKYCTPWLIIHPRHEICCYRHNYDLGKLLARNVCCFIANSFFAISFFFIKTLQVKFF